VNQGYVKEDFNDIFSFKVSLPKKIRPAIPQEDIATVLKQIDRDLPKGMRDYAIILLGAVTGLRACDIAMLKLNDIDWRIGEIRLIQKKTGDSLFLPLTKDVGKALEDYILNGRVSPIRVKQKEYEEVFLSTQFPCGPITAHAIRNVYDYYRVKSDIKSSTFHDLRRSVGKNMVTANISVDMVAQVLGIADIDTTKQYISLDSEHLKECALDFSGIALKGGVQE
jgi:integrase